ncbi:hypothetical protein [Prosthecobacter sp.]|uniref:hypothetical protein n=1 Tax=Prosthecobacter sp. TaxID=1965333 RepID=UPI002489F285|nr:hypothetical protein [Prosthecobacter sp.]MDI1311375.1 hypothetical protein [Prosthecobacter sp.]
MKPVRHVRPELCFGILLLGIIAATGHLKAQQARPGRDVVSEEALRQQVAGVPSLKSQLTAKARPLTKAAPSIQSSLWTNSIILADGEKFTLVPVGAILHLPAELRTHVAATPQGDFTFWPSFLKRNSTWLAAKEVPLSLSRGNTQEAKALLKNLSYDKRLIVATYKDGPITILEPAPTNSDTHRATP